MIVLVYLFCVGSIVYFVATMNLSAAMIFGLLLCCAGQIKALAEIKVWVDELEKSHTRLRSRVEDLEAQEQVK